MLIVMCPVCASRDIREKNVAYTELRVASWERNDHGGLEPSEYDIYDDVSPEWSSSEDADPYVCHGTDSKGDRCTWEGDLHELLIHNEPDDEE